MMNLITMFILYISDLCDEEKFHRELNKRLRSDPENEILLEMQRFNKEEGNLFERRYEQWHKLEPLVKKDPEDFEKAFMRNLGDWFFDHCGSNYYGMNGFAHKLSEMPSVEEYIKSFDFYYEFELMYHVLHTIRLSGEEDEDDYAEQFYVDCKERFLNYCGGR